MKVFPVGHFFVPKTDRLQSVRRLLIANKLSTGAGDAAGKHEIVIIVKPNSCLFFLKLNGFRFRVIRKYLNSGPVRRSGFRYFKGFRVPEPVLFQFGFCSSRNGAYGVLLLTRNYKIYFCDENVKNDARHVRAGER